MEIAWAVVAVLVPLLLGAPLNLVGLAPPEFRKARACFYSAALILGGMSLVWQVQTDKPLLFRLVVGISTWALIGAGLPEALRWVNAREKFIQEMTPVTVSPASIDLSSKSWAGKLLKAENTIRIHNLTSEVCYQVWVKLAIQSPVIEPYHLAFKQVLSGVRNNTQKLTLSHEGRIFLGQDANGHKAVWLLLASLDPNQTLPIQVSSTYPGLTGDKNVVNNAQITIAGFSKEPSNVFKGSGATLSDFKPPEQMTVTGTGLLVVPKDE